MDKAEIRPQMVKDAGSLYGMFNDRRLVHSLGFYPKSLEKEKRIIRENKKRWREGKAYNYTILYEGEVAGVIALRIDPNRDFIGEIGYHVDPRFWGRGIAPAMVGEAERIAFESMGMKRIEIIMSVHNHASERVAVKCGYEREATMRKRMRIGEEYVDAHMYAKVGGD